ncbi:hypothetical protein ACHAWF_002027 [Thalassiosira exigua]
MFLLYILLRGIPTETSDPCTKEPYGLPLVLHVFGQVAAVVLELFMALVSVDIAVGGLVAPEVKDCLADYLAPGLLATVPGICLLITAMISSGAMEER